MWYTIFPATGSEDAGREEVTEMAVPDLTQGHLTYVQSDHEKKEPVWDAFLFTVTDGVSSSPAYRFNFTIIVSCCVFVCRRGGGSGGGDGVCICLSVYVCVYVYASVRERESMSVCVCVCVCVCVLQY